MEDTDFAPPGAPRMLADQEWLMTSDDDYLDYIRPRGLPVLKATLRVIVAVQCLGAAAQWLAMGQDSTIANFLFFDLNWPEAQAAQFDTYAAYGLMACGILTLVRPCWPVLLPVTGWFLAVSLISLVRDEGAIPVLDPVEQAARYGGPLALLILDFWPPRLKSHLGRTFACVWLLRLAAAATFAGHGIVAITHSMNGGHYVDLLMDTTRQVFGWDVSEDNARWMLAIIGGIDIGLALNVVASRSKPIVFYMAIWGLATAATRVVSLGPQAYPETLIRVANGGLPLVILLYWSLSIKQPPVEVVKSN